MAARASVCNLWSPAFLAVAAIAASIASLAVNLATCASALRPSRPAARPSVLSVASRALLLGRGGIAPCAPAPSWASVATRTSFRGMWSASVMGWGATAACASVWSRWGGTTLTIAAGAFPAVAPAVSPASHACALSPCSAPAVAPYTSTTARAFTQGRQSIPACNPASSRGGVAVIFAPHACAPCKRSVADRTSIPS